VKSVSPSLFPEGSSNSTANPVWMGNGSVRKFTPFAFSRLYSSLVFSTTNQIVGFASGNLVVSFKMIAGSLFPTLKAIMPMFEKSNLTDNPKMFW